MDLTDDFIDVKQQVSSTQEQELTRPGSQERCLTGHKNSMKYDAWKTKR